MLFFFQAEDGIRARDVTGVQTCALPIFDVDRHALAQRQSLEVGAVGAQRGLVVGAAVDVVEDRLRDALFRELAQILDVGHHRHGAAFYNARESWLPPGTSRRTRSR